ncbi:MAG: hypothetical protein WA896_02095 [Spirulinaceae cyanobacterium]
MINVVGKIEQKGFGFGTWALVTEDGQTYELKDAPDELRQPEIKVKVKGTVREDVMSTAMIGPILEVESFEITDQ